MNKHRDCGKGGKAEAMISINKGLRPTESTVLSQQLGRRRHSLAPLPTPRPLCSQLQPSSCKMQLRFGAEHCCSCMHACMLTSGVAASGLSSSLS